MERGSARQDKELQAVDLTSFSMALDYVTRLAVDAVIVIPEAKGWWTDTAVNAAVKEIMNADKHIVAIENGPSETVNFDAGIAIISSNSRK